MAEEPVPPAYLRMQWCLRLGITPSQFDQEDIADWRQFESMLGIEARLKKQWRFS